MVVVVAAAVAVVDMDIGMDRAAVVDMIV
jgi:hypothetical protein